MQGNFCKNVLDLFFQRENERIPFLQNNFIILKWCHSYRRKTKNYIMKLFVFNIFFHIFSGQISSIKMCNQWNNKFGNFKSNQLSRRETLYWHPMQSKVGCCYFMKRWFFFNTNGFYYLSQTLLWVLSKPTIFSSAERVCCVITQ